MDAAAPWAPILEKAGPHNHVALVYRDEGFLARAVATWSAAALRAGGGAILVGTAIHALMVRDELRRAGFDVDDIERAGRLLIIDADWLMARFVIDGTPDRSSFRELAAEIIRGVLGASAGGAANTRAWGEMVSLLRVRGNPAAARRLEELWGEVIAEHGISLFCSYAIDDRGEPEYDRFVGDVLLSHDHVLLQPEGEAVAPGVSTG